MLDNTDRDNLTFILTIVHNEDKTVFDDWLKNLSADETDYALNLLKTFDQSRIEFVNSI